MPTIRQEINILDFILSAGSGSSNTSSETVQLDTTQYNGATYYFEIVADTTVSLSVDITLNGATDGTLATCNIPLLTTAYTLIRSASFTPTTETQNCNVVIPNTVGATKNVKSARIVIIQNPATLTNTETQIEICGTAGSATTSTTPVPVTDPKYWKYTAGNWDGTITVYFEATCNAGNSKSGVTVSLQVADGTGDGFAGWTDVTNSPITSTSLSVVRVRSAALTLTTGRWYRAAFKTGTSKSGVNIYNAKVIIDQVDGADIKSSTGSTLNFIGGTGNPSAQAQGFKIQTTSTITAVDLRLLKTGSPTDTIQVDITSSLGGSSLASATLAGSGLTSSHVTYKFTFGTPVSLTGGTKYYIQVSRSPNTLDNVNYYSLDYHTNSQYPDGGNATRNNATWGSESATDDFYFLLYGHTGITKLEPQYLLLNTLAAAGTALQTYLTKWDSTEWSSVTNTYTGQAEAANGSTSDILIQEADAGSTVATINNPDNAATAAATMPADQNLDFLANTNAGDVAGVRILVACVVSTTSGPAVIEATNTEIRDPAAYTPGQYYSIRNFIRKLKYIFYGKFIKI